MTPLEVIADALRPRRHLTMTTGEDRPRLLARLALEALDREGFAVVRRPDAEER